MRHFLIPAFLFISLATCQNQNPVSSTQGPLPLPAESGNPAQIFEQVRDSLRFFDEPRTLDSFVAKYDYLKSRFQDSPDPNVRKLLLDWRNYLPVTVETAEAVRRGSLPSDLLEPALFYLSLTALQNAQLEEAFAYDQQLRTAFARSPYLQQPTRMLDLAHATKHSLDSLAVLDLRPDERLWALGNIWAAYVEESGLFVMETSGYNYALARPYLEELTKKYPDSPFADDATFELINFSLSGIGEGGDASYWFAAAQIYEQALTHFPNSDLRAKILLLIAGWYQAFDPGSSDNQEDKTQIIHSCQRGISVAEQRLREFPNPPERAESEEIITRLRQKIAVYSLELGITANKTAYREGEPILIRFSLTNPTSQAIDIRLSYLKNCPNFSLMTDCEAENRPEGSWTMYLEATSKTCQPGAVHRRIEAGKTYRETWDVTLPLFEGAPGSSNRFPGPGRYTLRGQLDLQASEQRVIRSDNIRIQILN